MPWNRWQRRRPECVEQVVNAPDANADLTPVSGSYAEATRAGWLPWFMGQDVPLIWERVTPDEPCDP